MRHLRRLARPALVSLLILLLVLGIWYAATAGPTWHWPVASAGMTAEQIEYAKMMGKDPVATKTSGKGFPTLGQMGTTVWGSCPTRSTTTAPTTRALPSSWPIRWAGWGWAFCWPAWWPFRWAL
jgi:hypothetical protein